ncbi:MAG: hypothetical protein QM820_43755 [Minicystis sp.]
MLFLPIMSRAPDARIVKHGGVHVTKRPASPRGRRRRMSDEIGVTHPAKLFIGCFSFISDRAGQEQPDGRDGTFQLIVEATDLVEAQAKCRARLHEIAGTTGSLGNIVVYAEAFIEAAPGDLARGLVVNCQDRRGCAMADYLPAQGDTTSAERFVDDPCDGADGGPVEDDEDATSGLFARVFWARWKLYWCATDDHHDDRFVVARTADEAAAFHADAAGYDGNASADLVCFLPDSERLTAERKGTGWPSHETLMACGAEVLPSTSRDGPRVVRINGRVYCEGDIVQSTARRRQRQG